MDDIQDFITDHHYNQAIRKKSVANPEDAIAEAVLDTWPPLPKDVASAQSVEEFKASVTLEKLFKSPVGRYFLIEKLLAGDGDGIAEPEVKPVGTIIKHLEEFHLEEHHSMVFVERHLNMAAVNLNSVPRLRETAEELRKNLEALHAAYEKQREVVLADLKDSKEENMQPGLAEGVPEDGEAASTEADQSTAEDAAAHSAAGAASPMSPGRASGGSGKSQSSRKRPSKAALARMASMRSSRSAKFGDDLNEESMEAIVMLEEYFVKDFRTFFEPLEAKLKAWLGSALNAFKEDAAALAKYRRLDWYSSSKEIRMSDFVIFRDLGRGAFGVVSGARHRITGQLVALKGMNRKLVKGKRVLKLVKQEFQILKKLGEYPSPFCVSLSYAFMEDTDMYFGLPLMTGGDLMFHICREHKGYGLERARFFAAEILLGVQHMHNLGIVYRDLKPENVLLDEDGHTKISDMGLAVLVKFTPYTRGNKVIRGRAGTPGYWPPEMIKGEGYAFDADWWSWAVMLYEFMVGICPFSEHHTRLKDRNDATLNWEIQYPDVDGKPFDADCQDLLSKMLERDRYKRLGTQPDTAEQIMAHPFFKSIDWANFEAGKAKPSWKPPSNSINAVSQADLETRNKEAKFKKVVLTDEDKIEGFNFSSREHLYDIELVLHLERKGKLSHLKETRSQHCTIL